MDRLADRFLVCGLGSLGQHCVVALRDFGVSVVSIEQEMPKSWEIPNLQDFLEMLLIGDCRQSSVLLEAKIHQCRAVLLVTSSEQVNIQAAFAVRSLNPTVRLVVRSAKQNLNDLLGDRLGNFVAYEPTQLPASAFALAALDREIIGFFNLDDQQVRVVKRTIEPNHPWCDRRQIHEINNRARRVLAHGSQENEEEGISSPFHRWEPDTRLGEGDTIVFVEVPDLTSATAKLTQSESGYGRKIENASRNFRSTITMGLLWQRFKQKLVKLRDWVKAEQIRRVAAICGMTLLLLVFVGTILFRFAFPQISLQDAFYTTSVLLLGGYGDLFGQVHLELPIPWWLRLFALGLSLTGIAFVGVLYGLLTQSLLSLQFQFLSRRPPLPQQDHIVLIGFGRIGKRVAALLQELDQSLIAVSAVEVDPSVLPQVPLIVGDLTNALTKVNLATAKSVITVTDDEMVNLEIGMMAHNINPKSSLVIRTFARDFSSNLAQLLPYAQVLCAHSLAAEAFATTAFGENVLSLFRLQNQTILVTEYFVEAGDTLDRLLLSEVAYGYGVMPILYQEPPKEVKFMPSEDLRLKAGDRLVVLATLGSLRGIESGEIESARHTWSIDVEKSSSKDAIFEGAKVIARVSGCSVGEARVLLEHLPCELKFTMHKHQVQRLVRELAKAQVYANLIS